MTRFILTILPLALPLYVVRFHIGPLPTTALEIIILLSLAIWMWTCGMNGWRAAYHNLRKRGWVWPLFLWLLAGTISIFVAADTIAALGLWRAYFLEPILVFAMLADLIRADEDKPRLLRSLALVTIVLGAWSALQYLTILPTPAPWHAPPSGFRATGPFPYPNALALFVVPIAALCFARIILRPPLHLALRKGEKILLWAGFAGGLIATILAKSDGGLIALTAAMFVTLLIRRPTRIPVIIIAIASLALAFAVPSSRSTITNQLLFKQWSGKVRLVMWQETREMLADTSTPLGAGRPIFGAGLGGFPDAIRPYHKATWMEIFQYPHNILLNLWSEVGLLGVFAFGWILLTWVRHSGSGYSLLATRYSLPIITAILIHGLVDVPYFKNDLAVLFWMLVAVTQNVP